MLASWLVIAAAAQEPAFDVASITPSQTARWGGEGSGREHIVWTPAGVTIENASLAMMVEWAWQVKPYQVSGPGWTFEERYNLRAKCGAPATLERLRLMLRTLLAERFRLALGHGSKEVAGFELLPDRGGPKLAAAKSEEEGGVRVENGRFVLRGATTAELAAWLSELAVIDRPVLDRTGMAGRFDGSLPAIPYPAPEGVDPGWIFTAIRQELGLMLRPSKSAVEVLTIERAERPSGN